jgi:acetyl-CoA carboxylase biotin carboxyl carrier protein
MLSDRDVREFAYEDADVKLRLRYGAEVVTVAAPHAVAAHAPVAHAAPAQAPAHAPAAAAEQPSRVVTVEAPMVGTLYRSSAPGAKPFVEVGDRVQKGQVLCIIEAMKLMNELESEVSGKVTAILIENGSPVQFGQALFLVDPS